MAKASPNIEQDGPNRYSRHSKSRVLVHFVWSTRQRQPFLTPDIERRVYDYIAAVCYRDGCQVLAVGGTDNHVHLLLYLGHDITISRLMQHVKGASSRFAKETLGALAFTWQRGYGAFGVSPHDRRRVSDYVLNQKEHHRRGSLWPGAEEDGEDVVPVDTNDVAATAPS